MVINKRVARGTPFITNVAKEVHQSTKNENNVENNVQQVDTNTRNTKSRKNEAGTIINQSQSYANPSTMQPTFKLEMFQPQPQQQRPYGIYNPYMPTPGIYNPNIPICYKWRFA